MGVCGFWKAISYQLRMGQRGSQSWLQSAFSRLSRAKPVRGCCATSETPLVKTGSAAYRQPGLEVQSHTRGDGPAALTDAGHLAEGRSPELAVRLAEHRDVQGVDRLGPEL